MIEFVNSHVFGHEWSNITQANWQKYPNEHSPHINSVDIVERKVTGPGILDTVRLIGCKQQVPYLLRRLVGSADDEAYVYETSKVDVPNRTMKLVSRNVTFSKLVTVDETCTYTPNPIDESTTLFEQRVRITAIGVPGWIVNSVEAVMADNYKKTASKGRNALNEVCDMVVLSPFSVVEHMMEEARDEMQKMTSDFSRRASERLSSVFDWDSKPGKSGQPESAEADTKEERK
ncbi:hypothetical protein SARC_09510 [Sphaeroforma arctica JP610]|uniref:PRELI/MSF1 domain-containing protein n=1 Tax=Sphaeroforma arctica JP610 TaxID=667725 RepID=A0A0L0FMQ9_9EUKA|nr:hypothetical protein SARC_09510 [Sphaeroforma arctica JP610]KNC78045.1 hypothetical protein SARC_09510 [Sphaeroforma arctica JP610]|eukprot:XP_014151947.1 hypothetical protein SARC_09510 [Sphaeroforma arctica JP610]